MMWTILVQWILEDLIYMAEMIKGHSKTLRNPIKRLKTQKPNPNIHKTLSCFKTGAAAAILISIEI